MENITLTASERYALQSFFHEPHLLDVARADVQILKQLTDRCFPMPFEAGDLVRVTGRYSDYTRRMTVIAKARDSNGKLVYWCSDNDGDPGQWDFDRLEPYVLDGDDE